MISRLVALNALASPIDAKTIEWRKFLLVDECCLRKDYTGRDQCAVRLQSSRRIDWQSADRGGREVPIEPNFLENLLVKKGRTV